MHDYITQVGVAGLLIWLFLKEMFTFLAKRKAATNGSGDKSVEFWELRIAEIVGHKMEHLFNERNGEIRRIVREELSGYVLRKK